LLRLRLACFSNSCGVRPLLMGGLGSLLPLSLPFVESGNVKYEAAPARERSYHKIPQLFFSVRTLRSPEDVFFYLRVFLGYTLGASY